MQRQSRSSAPLLFKDHQNLLPLRLSKSVGLWRLSRSSASLHFKDLNVFYQDYHSLLYFSKTIKVFCHAKTIKVICLFSFQRLSEFFVLQRQSRSSAFYFLKTIRVFCLQDYQSLLSCGDYQCLPLFTFSKTIRVFCFKTITVFFTFPRLSKFVVLQRLSMSSTLCIFKDHQSLLFQRLLESSIETSMSPLLLKTSRSFVWCTWCLLRSFFWQVSLFGFPLVAGLMARSLGWN